MAEYVVRIPSDVDVKIEGGQIKVSGPKGQLERYFDLSDYNVSVENGVFKISLENPRSKQKAMMGTIAAHLRNMIRGVREGYEYRLKIVYAHFPINVSVDGNRLVIKNFAGEKTPRYAHILPETQVEIKGQEIIVRGIDKEKVGQTAANIENATRIKRRDLRVFGDGIFIISKGK